MFDFYVILSLKLHQIPQSHDATELSSNVLYDFPITNDSLWAFPAIFRIKTFREQGEWIFFRFPVDWTRNCKTLNAPFVYLIDNSSCRSLTVIDFFETKADNLFSSRYLTSIVKMRLQKKLLSTIYQSELKQSERQ